MKKLRPGLILKNAVPEWILAFIGSCLFLTDSNIANPISRALCFLVILILFAFCKSLLTVNVLRTEILFSGNNRFLNYIFILIEFGILLNLYIVGFTADSMHILNYFFGLIKPLAIFISIALIFQVLAGHDQYHKGKAALSIAVSFLLIWGFSIPEEINAGTLLRTAAVPVLESALIVLSLVILYGLLSEYHGSLPVKLIRHIYQKLCRHRNASLLIWLVYTLVCMVISGMAVLHIFDGNGMLTARVAAVELLKLYLLASLAMMQCVNHKKLEKPRKEKYLVSLRNFLEKYECRASLHFWWTSAFFAVTMIPLFLCGEFGTCLILAVLFVLMTFSCFNAAFGLTEIVCGTGIYLLIRKGYLMGIFGQAAEEKLNRLFNLDAFTQINDMNQIIDESNVIFQVIPYHVRLTGQLTTRIEDFSYLNIISVFGTLFAAVFLIWLLIVPYLALQDFDERAKRSSYEHNLFLIAKWPLLLFIANITVHVMSNLGIFMFTGVTLPLISNGFMNTIITIISFIPVIKCLGLIAYEKTEN